ncbi:M3 family metallopeptidase [Nocardioides nanhaiensis]|uniref:M3 family metallopeptidase n=1 Tax=Nocardioides nanhaiensis TaxID=1476871 RepID=A0ABP8VRI9_9ACTN
MSESPQPLTLPDAEEFEAWVRERAAAGMAQASELVAALKADPTASTVTALESYDRAVQHLGEVAAMGSLFSNVHPDAGVRAAAEEAESQVMRVLTELGLDRELFEVVAGLDGAGLDDAAARLLAHVRRDFTRSGVDRDDATRARITAVRERLTELDQEFSRQLREDVRSIRVAPERLEGLPEDWRAAHPPEDDGLVTVTTDYPDAVPTRMYAHDAQVRHDMAVAFLSKGWPQNDAVLKEMFALRHELAGLVGHSDWASYDAEVKMIGSGPAIPAFIDRIADAAEEPMRRDLAVLLERYRADHPDAEEVPAADAQYYSEAVRRERYEVDSQEVRRYFDFTRVRAGLLEVTARLFGLRYEPVPDAVTWHPEVTVHDVHDADAPAGTPPFGRIYLDLHPRAGKYSHAAQFTLTDGVAGRRLPEGVLVCNFSRELMEHDHVVTLFHEFGHLLHHVLGGRGRWARFAGVATEWDFVEAPSQMLEEWAWNHEVLATFAHDAAGTPIPPELVERMRAGEEFGKGVYARTQMFYAAMSYWFHTERPEDLEAAMRRLQERYAPFGWIEGTRMFASFGHLGGYSSGYYTYMWSLVIAKDLFSAFDEDDLFDTEVARRYREAVLEPGGRRDAADLVADFLGRPSTFESYEAWLAR